MSCVGLDWAERHHDLVVLAETGEWLAELRVGAPSAAHRRGAVVGRSDHGPE